MSDEAPRSSLKSRVVNAGSWVVAGQIASSVVRLGGNLVLTRLLAPEIFGLMAIVYVMMFGFALLSDIGLGPNIVHSKRGEDQDFLDTAWIIQIIRGALVWLGALLLSVGLYVAAQLQWLPAESVYANPQLPWVVAAYSVTQLIVGFYPTRLLVQGRRFSLARITQIEIAQQIICLGIIIVWALISPTIWAQVAGNVITALLRIPIYHFFLPGRSNRWHWDKSAFKEILGFGKWIFASSVLGFIAMSGDRLILGGLVDAHQMGIYSIAFLIVSTPQVMAVALMGKVAFPALGEVVRNNPARLRDVYYKFRLIFDSATLFASGVFFTFGDALIRLLYDDRYHDAGHIVEILTLSVLATRYQLTDRCYQALGKPKMQTPVQFVRLVSLFVLIPVAYRVYQFEGALWAIALSPFTSLPLTFHFKIKHRLFDWKKELMVLPVFAVGAVFGVLLTYLSGPAYSIIISLRAMVQG